MWTTIKIAWRNLGRHQRRTALAVLAIAVGQTAVLAMNGLMHGYVDNIRLAITGPMIGHVQVHAPKWREERAMDLVIRRLPEQLAAVRRDAAVANAGARIYAPVLVAPKRDAFAAVVVGVDIAVESQDYGLLSDLKTPLAPRQVLIGHRLARKIQAGAGDEIAVVGQAADGSLANDLYVVQEVIKSPADLVNQMGIVMSLADAQELLVMPDEAHEIVIRTRQSGQSEALAARLAALPELHGEEVRQWRQIVPELTSILEMSDWVGYFVLLLVFLAAIAGIANTLMMSTFERQHEFGMLLALGTQPRRLVGMIVLEGLFLGIVGVAVGSLLGGVLVGATAHFGGIDLAAWSATGQAQEISIKELNLPLHIVPRLESPDVLLGFAAVMVTSLIAAIWPAWIAARLEPMEAMRA